VTPRRLIAGLAAVVALTLVAVLTMGGGSAQHPVPPAPRQPAAVATDPAPKPAAWTVPGTRPPGRAFLIGRVLRPIHSSIGLVRPRTPLGNQTWLLILSHHGHRGVALVPTSHQPKRATVDLRLLELRWTRVRLTVDLRALRLSVQRGTSTLGRFPIAAGGPSTPTPTGEFTVTDRVVFPEGGTYGPFALGLSARQTHLIPGWTGGDQIAIHGTTHPQTIGSYASLGCIRVGGTALKVLRRVVPLGAPVTIRA